MTIDIWWHIGILIIIKLNQGCSLFSRTNPSSIQQFPKQLSNKKNRKSPRNRKVAKSLIRDTTSSQHQKISVPTVPESRPGPLETSDHCRSPSAKRSSTTVHWQSETAYFVTKCQKMIITLILQVITSNIINYIECIKIYPLVIQRSYWKWPIYRWFTLLKMVIFHSLC